MFVWFKGKIVKLKEKTKKSKISVVNETDFDTPKLYQYQYKTEKLISSEAKSEQQETTNLESTHQSIQAKKENQGNNTLHNCRHCQGYGCLRCNDTGFDGH